MKRKWWCALLVVVVFSLGEALASSRLSEMISVVQNVLEEGEERDIFFEGIADYITEREAALGALVVLVESASEDELRGEWDDTVADLFDIPVLSDLDDELSSEAALELYDQFMDEEQEWVSALSVLNTAGYRDEIVALRIRLEVMTEELETTWQKQLNDDGQIDEKQFKVMADINTVVVSLAQQSDALRQSLRDKAQLVAEVASSEAVSSSFPGPIGDLLTLITEGIKYLNTYKTTLESLKPQLKDLAA
jgi:hypothetical protein